MVFFPFWRVRPFPKATRRSCESLKEILQRFKRNFLQQKGKLFSPENTMREMRSCRSGQAPEAKTPKTGRPCSLECTPATEKKRIGACVQCTNIGANLRAQADGG